MAPAGKRKPVFHLLRVAELDRITDDDRRHDLVSPAFLACVVGLREGERGEEKE